MSVLPILLILCAFGFAGFDAQEVEGAEKEIRWDEVHPEIREQTKAVTKAVSGVLGMPVGDVDYEFNGSDIVQYLKVQPFEHSFEASWLLRGVDKAGRKLAPDARTRRGQEYGATPFQLRLRNLKELPSKEALKEMREGRRLDEAVHDLSMQSFWVKYNLVRTADAARGPTAQQIIEAAVDKAKKQLDEINPRLIAAKKRQKERITAQELELLEAKEAKLRSELATRRRQHQEQIAKMREHVAAHPELQAQLPAALDEQKKSLADFESRIKKRLDEIEARRQVFDPKKIPEQVPKQERLVDKFLGQTQPLGTLEEARLTLSFSAGTSKLWSRAFSTSTGNGLIFEVDSFARRAIRAVEYHWPCGPYLVTVTASIVNSVVVWAEHPDGNHQRVPFLGQRLKQAETVKNAVAAALERTKLCEGTDGYWLWTGTYAVKAEQYKSRIDEIKLQLDTLAKEKAAHRADFLTLMHERMQAALPGEGTTVLGKHVVAVQKQARDDLAAKSRQKHEEQRGLLEEAEKLLDERLSLLEQQVEKSKDARSRVQAELEAFKIERPAMVIMGGGIHLAEQHEGVGGRLLAEALAELSGQEIAYDILSRSGTPLRKLIGEVDEFGLVLVKKQARLDDLRHVLGELNALTKDSTKLPTRALEKAARKVDDATGTVVTRAVPDTVEQGLDHALGGVVKALCKGDFAEAREALKVADGFADRLGKEVSGLRAKVDEAKGLLAKARTRMGSLLERPRPAGKLKSLHDEGIPPGFIAEEALYDLPGSGRFLDAADDAFQRGELDEAIQSYRRARRWAKRHDQDAMVKALDDRLALAAGTQKAQGILSRLRKRTHTIVADRNITNDEITELIGQFQKGKNIKTLPGGSSPVFEFTD